LLALYQALAKLAPRQGDAHEWKRRTKALVDGAQGVIDGDKGAAEKLAAAVDCKSCHALFRPKE
jgi:cytochrome c556